MTDWRGNLRVGRLVIEAVGLLIRHPVVLLLLPTAVLALTRVLPLPDANDSNLLFWSRLGLPQIAADWLSRWLNPATLVTLPFVSVLCAWASRRMVVQRAAFTLVCGRVSYATMLGTGALLLAVVALAIAGPFAPIAAALIVARFPTTLPLWACERVSGLEGLRRAWAHGRRHGTRLLGAWVLLAAALWVSGSSCSGVPMVPRAESIELIWTGASIGTTLALCIATYIGLRATEVIPDDWVEVFR